MDVVVTSGAIRCAKLQSTVNTNKSTPSFFTGRMPFLSPNERQSTEGKEIQLNKDGKAINKMHSLYCTVLYEYSVLRRAVMNYIHCSHSETELVERTLI